MLEELYEITKSFDGTMTWEDFNDAIQEAIAMKKLEEMKRHDALREAQNETDEEQSWG